MIDQGQVSDNEMISEFLRAEIDSPLRKKEIMERLSYHRRDRKLIDMPNIADANENAIRRDILNCTRGYPSCALFRGFPLDVSWRKFILESDDFTKMRYINDVSGGRHWINLSGGTRLVADGARNFCKREADPTTPHDELFEATHPIASIAKAFENGVQFPALIAAATTDESLIIIEGHKRATACIIAKVNKAKAIVALSPNLPAWDFY